MIPGVPGRPVIANALVTATAAAAAIALAIAVAIAAGHRPNSIATGRLRS